ncbi:hypothetical protein [Vibrio sp. WXL103]|uniref:hypothetical protein n=1 Tax=unclassified Vibrio TaxID=2614977 RepID=UPI003EC798D2
MNKKLGQVMTSSRMVSFIAFLFATFAWILNLKALFTFSLIACVASASLYWSERRLVRGENRESRSEKKL